MTSTFGAVCAQGLAGAPVLNALPFGSEWDTLFDRAVDERAVSMFACAAAEGSILVTPTQDEQLLVGHEEAMRSCVLLERWSLEVANWFATAGIEMRLLKGPAVAHLDYPDPAWRAFGDIDVLVRSAQYDDAMGVLLAAGGRRRSQEVRAGFDRRFGKGACVTLPNGVQVDVHRTLASGPFGLTVDLDELFRNSEVLYLAGEAISVLSRELRLVHACFHAALGDATPRAVALRDVAQMLESSELDFDEVRRIAKRWRAEIVLARAISLTWDALSLPVTPVTEWAVQYRGDRFERRALSAYVGTDRSYARQMLAGLPAVSGLPAKISYIRSLVFVDPAYARRHGGGIGRRVQRAWNVRSRREPVA